MAQTSYNSAMVKGLEGQKADTNFDDVLSRSAAGDVPFGRGVVESSNVGESVLPSASGFYFDGVTLHTHSKEQNSSGVAQYEQYDAMSVLRRGRVWVKPEVAVSIGDDVYLRHTTGTATQLPGMFRNDADTNKADQVKGAKWLTETTGTFELALLEIRGHYE